VEDDDDLTKLTKIEVMRDDKGNDWFLDQVLFFTSFLLHGFTGSGEHTYIILTVNTTSLSQGTIIYTITIRNIVLLALLRSRYSDSGL
jgi:hypothetical protein